MTQAATLTQQQLQRVLDCTRTRRHYKRNRAIILLTHYAMLRVGEVAALRYCDVVDADGEIKAETTLSAAQTKGNKALRFGLLKRYVRNLLLMWQRTNPSNLHSHCFTRNAAEGLQLTR
jgi:integrase/recombinase XerD